MKRPDLRPPLRPDLRPPLRPKMRPEDPHSPLSDEEGEVRELTAEDFANMRPLAEVDPGMVEAAAEWRKALNKGGRPKLDAPKEHISFRLAADLVAAIKASGPGYNARAEQALRVAFVTPGEEGRIAKKYGNTQIKTLRKIYGASFAKG